MSGDVVIAAGGTGGHFFPAEALAAELLSRGHGVTLMTDARSGGEGSAVFAGQRRHVLRGAGIAGRGALRGAQAAMALAAGTLQARALLAAERPAAIVGFGGYPTIAPVLASRLLRHRPRVVLHEQNAVLGRANRALSHFADALALSFANTSGVPRGMRAQATGNPVRPAIAAVAASPYRLPEAGFALLVLGGSLGARVFSDVVPAAVALLPEALRTRLHITQQCRAEDLDRVRAAYAALGLTPALAPFFADVARLLVDCSLAVTRAGASTIAELAAIGRPAILVPLPGAIDDHQSANARALTEAGGAWAMAQPGFTPAALAERLTALAAAPPLLETAARQAARLGRTDAAARLADLVEHTIAGGTRA